jgi:hypothetical protein
MTQAEYRLKTARLETPKAELKSRIDMQQVLLVQQAEIPLNFTATAVAMDYVKGAPAVVLDNGKQQQILSLADMSAPEGFKLNKPVIGRSVRFAKERRAWVGGKKKARWEMSALGAGKILEGAGPAAREVARFTNRPWYVGGARLGEFLARLNERGDVLRIYRVAGSARGFERAKSELVLGPLKAGK